MSVASKRVLFPSRENEGTQSDPAAIRQTICDRLRVVSEMVGSVSAFADEVGVNRTQLSRYLNGQSIPRPEFLVRVSSVYNLPLNWLMVPHEDPDVSLSEHQLSGDLHRMFARRHFQLNENLLPSGLYMFWKGLFQQPGRYEGYMASVKLNNGVAKVRTIMIKNLRRYGILEKSDPIDHVCLGVGVKSHSGINISFSDSVANVMATSFLLPASPLRFRSNDTYSGFMSLSYTPGRDQLNWVPCVMELLPANVSDVLAAARRSGVYDKGELPEEIQHQIDTLDIPQYGLR
ncbi:helix-turn-helix domain-containing protein [Halocynthiibacter styelae]|uniref:Helix-turn-helix transcriptional regulator n=1 Tax=Halocynthiibacter styelae TaxID=2761955 RepID=A0A8J7LKL4_9RHOB|nr:helix-turn-helix transcriptional regulator [Paenihalocynthiibacter styelae]MBI1492939.1 helix-turn-helix transcriptional regulator [Paenihalocynthiibacter styelae]